MLERGVADAITFPWGSTILFGIDKVVKYHLDIPLYTTAFVWVLNKAKYEAMSPAQQKVIDNHCTTEWAVRFAGPWADFEHAGIAKIRAEPGAVIEELTPEQRAAWQQAAVPLHASWAANVRKTGADPDAVWKDLQAAIAANKAGL